MCLLQCCREKGSSVTQALGLPHKASIPCQSPAGWTPQGTAQASTPLLCWLSVADCKAPPELEHGFVTFSSRNNLTTFQAAIQYHCQHPFYHMAPNSSGEHWGQAVSPQPGEGGHRVCKWGSLAWQLQGVDVACTYQALCLPCLDCQTGQILLHREVR